MKLERWRRTAGRPWLLLRPALAAEAWQWALLEQGRLAAQGTGKPPAPGNARVALLLPGEQCSHFQVPAPPGLKRHEWPLLLEDRLLQLPQSLACGCVSREAGSLQLVCIDQLQVDGWLAQCEAWQLGVERCWAEFQLLPIPAAGHAWCWQRDGRLSLFKGCSEQGRQHWLAWPSDLPLETPPGIWSELQMDTQQGAWPEQWAALDALPSLLERQRGSRQALRLQPRHWRLPAACLALALLFAGLWVGQQWRQQAVYQAQVSAVIGPLASLRQASQALKRQRQSADERQLRLRQLQHLQTSMDRWLEANGSWQLSASRFDGQRWSLQLHGREALDAAPWQAMASEGGVTVQVSETADALQLVFDLGAAS